ncbi:hypothetical protein [Hyphomonas sp.]|jgi:hypothetical protein|uniref:hypothetical protein n=1 Tax=Hyphomonas sp. TaxID=87 RepID=UPI0032ECB27B
MPNTDPASFRLVGANLGEVPNARVAPSAIVVKALQQAGFLDVQFGAPGDGGLDLNKWLLDNSVEPPVLKEWGGSAWDAINPSIPSETTATGGTTARPFSILFKSRGLTPGDFGVQAGDLSAGAYTKMTSFLQAGGKLIVPDGGIWPLPLLTLTDPLWLEAHPEARFVANAMPTATNKGVLTLATGAEGSMIIGGIWDGDRDTLMEIPISGTWSSSGTTLTGSGGAALTEVSAGDYIRYNNRSREVASVSDNNTITLEVAFSASNRAGVPISEFTSQALTRNAYLQNAATLKIEAARCGVHAGRFVNAMQWGLYNAGDNFHASDLTLEDCGSGMLNGYVGSPVDGFDIRNIHFKDCGHLGSEFNRHIFMQREIYNGKASHILVDGVVGNDDTDFVSTVTAVLANHCVLEDCTIKNVVGNAAREVGFSMLHFQNGEVRNPRVDGVCGTMFEVAGMLGSKIKGGMLDGKFATTVGKYDGQPVGLNIRVSTDKYGGQPVDESVRVEGLTIRRVAGSGCQVTDVPARFFGTNFSGNRQHGLLVNNSSVPGETARVWLESTHEDYNGYSGVYASQAHAVHKHGGSCINNGQDSAAAESLRVGMMATSLEATGGFDLRDYENFDDQGVTWSDCLAYAPGSMEEVTVFESGGPVTRYRYSFTRVGIVSPVRLHLNQVVKLKSVTTAGAALTGHIVDYVDPYEEFVVEFETDDPILVPSGSRTAIAGTWSGAGTTLTGSGGNAADEVNYHDWITVSPFTEYRRVIAVGSDDSLTLESAFSTAPSGSTMYVVRGDIETIKSQQRGTDITSSYGYISGVLPNGNAVRNMRATAANLKGGSEFIDGGEVTSISATDTVVVGNFGGAGYAPLGARGICTAAIGGITAWTLEATTNGGGSTLATLASGSSALALNDKFNGGAAGAISDAVSPDIRFKTTGTPTGSGALKVEVLVRKNALENFSDV